MNSRDIKISVALIVCHGEKYMAEQLQSLQTQTLAVDEIIISDDSENTLTYEAIKPFLNILPIQYVKNPTPHGIAYNTANALKLCRGEYIFLCDQDDVWHPEKVETLCKILNDNAAADGVFCNSRVVNAQLQDQNFSLFDLRKFSVSMQKKVNQDRALEVFLRRVVCSSHNIAFRRRALEYILPMPELEPFFCDTWIGLAIAACSQWRTTARCLTDYRLHEKNLSSPHRNALSAARKARKNHAAQRNLLLAQTLLQRQAGRLDPEKEKQLEQFALYNLHRADYADNIAVRSYQILREVCSGRYFHFSNSWKTFIADWLLPRR